MERFKFWLSVGLCLQIFSQIEATDCSGALAPLRQNEGDSIYVLDTNIFHEDPGILSRLGHKHLVIPAAVVDELDRHKTERGTDRSVTARMASAEIKKRISASDAIHGIPLSEGGDLNLVEVSQGFRWPLGLRPENADHRILAVALDLQRANPERRVFVCSRDNNVALRARSLGLKTDDLAEEIDPETIKELTEGPLHIKASEETLGVLAGRPQKSLSMDDAVSLGVPNGYKFYENQFVIFASEKGEPFDLETALTRIYRFRRGSHSTAVDSKSAFFVPARREIAQLVISPRNIEQILTLDLLLDPNVHLVTLSGKAGTGKTLLTLMAALAQSPLLAKKPAFAEINLTRPNQMTGPEMGFLPGTIDEKMDPLLGPFYDNFAVIIEQMREAKGESRGIGGRRSGFRNTVLNSGDETIAGSLGNGLDLKDFIGTRVPVEGMVGRLKKSPFLKKIPLAYSRGRSLNGVFLIIDEGQNLTKHEVRTILTRAGEGTKVVLLGDVFQIDHPKLNRSNNGLAIVLSAFRGKGLAGHVNLVEGERSRLATMASHLLQ